MTTAVPALTFDAAVHEYRLPDGTRVPSVTEILSGVGVSVDFDALMAMSAERSRQIEAKRFLGTAVHADCHAYDDDDLVWDSMDPQVQPFVEAWAIFRQNTGLIPTTRERMVFHGPQFYCGTLDGIFLDPRDRFILVDIKTGDPKDAACQFQTAGYEAAYRFEHPEQSIAERWAVQLMPGLAVPYRITPYHDWRDAQTFAAFVTTFHNQAGRKRATR